MVQLNDLKVLTTEQLYKRGKSLRDLLLKREKRLRTNINRNPGRYSTHGLNIYEKEGIPKISTKMNRQELMVRVLHAERLKDMETGTSRGAKNVQDQTMRKIAGVAPTGRLNKKEQQAFDKVQRLTYRNPEYINDFWDLFEHYQKERAFFNLGSPRNLEDFRKIYNDLQSKGVDDKQQIMREISDIVKEEYEEEQRRRNSSMRYGRRGGRFT